MKAVAAAASIAGILTLAAQSISGVQRLRQFSSNVASASKTAQRFVYDLDLLLQVLQDVKILLDSTPYVQISILFLYRYSLKIVRKTSTGG